MKCNIDGAFSGCSGILACGEIFRDHVGNFLGGFSEALGTSNVSQVEIISVIRAIECSSSKGWTIFLLECDSSITIEAFSKSYLILWGILISSLPYLS
jgi:ribonuclease HI